ncbi:MAG: Tim44 domain-containing protein [Proteobacteria bacterium]|nr:Tim44 domain-containing protein [Pseudomonadota bacterium]MBU4296109.1 Tim44 domain-containing protein [Pseudomonadota bacterium]MCG2746742.1 Tim44 domain-containing protein [Desulfobulbaceae bacterium]
MSDTLKRFPLFLFLFFCLSLFDVALMAEEADARSRSGGRTYTSSPTYTKPPAQSTTRPTSTPTGGGFMRGMAGGLLGGAIGGMLFGGLLSGGSGIGLLPILLFGGIAFFIYRRFISSRQVPAYASCQQPMNGPGKIFSGSMPGGSDMQNPPPPPSFNSGGTLAEGIAMIRRSEPDFDPDHFKEVAQDVFFQVQAGWMRRDISSYRHLLGQRLAGEYESHFADMRAKGHINKLESMAVRKVEVVAAGVDNNEEFVTVLFTANLLDYTVDEHSNAIVSGSNTDPVKFAEKWTWARPIGVEIWKLEGVEGVQG